MTEEPPKERKVVVNMARRDTSELRRIGGSDRDVFNNFLIAQAIDAHRPEMVREMVEVRAHVRLAPGCSAYIVSNIGDLNGAWTDPMPGTALATLTARVPLPVIPTIPAKVVT
tara:strand:- start:1076 stop:1414 length:339 start_codon:yes stop_codon:yes gene_type:complete